MGLYHNSSYQTLKRYGRLPQVNLQDLDKLPLHGHARNVADEIAEDHWCGCPDYYDEEIADADPENVALFLNMEVDEAADLVSMHAAMYAAAKVGRGSFPAGCHSQYPGRHSASLHFNINDWRAHHQRPVTTKELQELVDAKYWGLRDLSHAQSIWGGKAVVIVAVDLAVESFRRRGIMLFPAATARSANIRLTCIPIAGSTIGLGWYNSQQCSNNVEARIDANWKSTLHGYARLITHEMGHCNNLRHEFTNQRVHKSVMSYSWPSDGFDGFRPGPPITKLPADASIPHLVRFYGHEMVPPAPSWLSPTDPPEPPSEETVWNWVQQLEFANGQIHDYAMQMTGPMMPGSGTGSFNGDWGAKKGVSRIGMQVIFQPWMTDT